MSRRKHSDDEPTLFDLPLEGPAEAGPPGRTPAEAGPPGRSPADAGPPDEPPAEADPPDPPPSGAEPAERPSAEAIAAEGPPESTPRARPPRPADLPPPLSVRYLAGLADLAIHAALAVALLFGARILGVRAGLDDWLPIALFLLVFSFFYSVLPLAFWGQTPGMAWAGMEARARDGASLTFPQTAVRWLGGVLSVALIGLPTLFAAGGRRSLADRLSDSDCRLTD